MALLLVPACDNYQPMSAYNVGVCGAVYAVITANQYGRMQMYSRETIEQYKAIEEQIKEHKHINIVPATGCGEVI